MQTNRFDKLIEKFILSDSDSSCLYEGFCVFQTGEKTFTFGVHIHDCKLTDPKQFLKSFLDHFLNDFENPLKKHWGIEDIQTFAVEEYFEFLYVVVRLEGGNQNLLTILVKNIFDSFLYYSYYKKATIRGIQQISENNKI